MKLAQIVESMQMVAEDCETDAARFDGQPLTGQAVGEMNGCTLAMVQACAKAIGAIAQELLEGEQHAAKHR